MTDKALCPYCGAAAKHHISAADLNQQITKQIFHYYRCPKDGLVFIHPVPEDLGRYYPQAYYHIPSDSENVAFPNPIDRYKLDILNTYAAGKRFLEIGSGRGDFAYSAQQAGYDVTVIEMDKLACSFIEETLHIRAINTNDIRSALCSLGTYDVIAMWHVIEHLPDAWKLLHEVSSHLNKNGILILTTPNPQSVQYRVFRRFWYHLDPPRHVMFIPIPLLIANLRSNGLVPIKITTDDWGSLLFTAQGWNHSWEHLTGNRFIFWRRVIRKLLQPLERTGNRRPVYLAIFQKD